MHTLILVLHIAVALITTVAILGVGVAAYRRKETRLYETMLSSFGATTLSGVALVFFVGGLGRFCAMMSAYVLFVVIARHYYRARLPATAL